MKGFIIIPRDLASDDRLATGEPFDRTHAFLDLVIHATHKEQTLTIRHAEVLLLPGEMTSSQRKLAERWHRSMGYVRKTLERLSRDGLIELKPQRNITIVKINDWHKYQGNSHQNKPDTEDNVSCDTDVEHNCATDKSFQNEPETHEIRPLHNSFQTACDTHPDTPKSTMRGNLQECLNNNNKYASPDASGLARFLLSEIRKNNPYLKTPDSAKWESDFQRMITRDQVPPGVLKKMIEFSQRNTYWNLHVISPYKLKVNFHKIFLEMNQNEKKSKKLIPSSQRLCYDTQS